MELIERLIRSGEPDALSDAFELAKELEVKDAGYGFDPNTRQEDRIYNEANFAKAHEYSRLIRSASAKIVREKGYEDMVRLNMLTLLFDGRFDFDCAFRFAEWDRPIERKFYEPRRKQLLPAVRALQRLEERKIRRLLIMAPPGIGKSTLAIAFMVWTGLRHPFLNILGVSNNNDFLKGTYGEVLNMLDPDGEYRWREIFPGIRIVGTNAEGRRIDLETRKPRFQTFQFGSIESKLAGKYRATNLLYCDDLVGNLEQAMNMGLMDKLWGAYTTDVRQRGQGDWAELMIQTPWSLHDPIDRLERLLENDPETEVLKMPAMNENDESNFNYPYGLGFTTEAYREQRDYMDDASWRALYMCQPIEREGQLYDPTELKRYFELPEREPDVVFAVVDTKETGPDYCACPIIYRYGDEFYVDKWICDNGNPDIIEDRIAQAFVDRGVKMARFESNRGGTLFAGNVQSKVKDKGGHTKITTKWNQTNKDTRIITRAGWVKDHCLFKDESLYTQDKEYRRAMDMLCSYNMAGKNKHDDVPDVMADVADYVETMSISSISVAKRLF